MDSSSPLSPLPRVLQLCAVDFTVYHFLLPLMRAQRDWGYEVEAACQPGDYVPLIEAEGFKVHPIRIARSKNPIQLYSAYRAIKRLCALRQYAAVHVHTPVAALAGRPAAWHAGVPVVLYTAHGFYFHDRMKPMTRRVYVALERWAQRYADFLFTQSAEDLQTAIHEGISSPGRAMAIGNGVDIQKFRPDLLKKEERAIVRAEFGIKPDEGPLVAMMGRLVREKGYFELIEAWKQVHSKFPAARLLVIGDALPSEHDGASDEIRQRAVESGAGDSIIFAGLRKDVPRLLAASDLFVLPSWREGLPRSIIEAMACGLPVIATDIRGCREEVVHGETGLLVPAQDAESLAGALEHLLDSVELRSRMGNAGRNRAVAEFSEEAVIKKQQAVYDLLLKNRNFTQRRKGAETQRCH